MGYAVAEGRSIPPREAFQNKLRRQHEPIGINVVRPPAFKRLRRTPIEGCMAPQTSV